MLDFFSNIGEKLDSINPFKSFPQYNFDGLIIQEEEVLAEGGYGYVHTAHDVNDPTKKYAIKKINVMDEANEEAVSREIENWKSLGDHPNICKFYGSTVTTNPETDTRTYVILCELCIDGTLVDFIT